VGLTDLFRTIGHEVSDLLAVGGERDGTGDVRRPELPHRAVPIQLPDLVVLTRWQDLSHGDPAIVEEVHALKSGARE